MLNDLRNFLALSYDQLEQLNLKAKEQRKNRVALHKIQEERLKYLTDEKRIKAVTVLFSDLEGRLHMLDYDKKFLIKSWDNLTFDGSSIRGFTAQRESDLRLGIDWAAFYWAPADYFGSGKVLVFGDVIDKDGTPYAADIRGMLKTVRRKAVQGRRLHPERGQRNRRLPASREWTRSGATTKPASSSTSTPAATITRCPATRCARSSTPPPKCSAPWASRTRRTIRKWRRRSSKSTTATAKWWLPPTRSSSTS